MKSIVIATAITLTAIAASLFFVVDKDTAAVTNDVADKTELGSVESMVGGLEQRLQKKPDDGKGWLLLAKSYRHMGRMDDARDAYQKAEALGSGDATAAAQLYGLEDTGASQ